MGSASGKPAVASSTSSQPEKRHSQSHEHDAKLSDKSTKQKTPEDNRILYSHPDVTTGLTKPGEADSYGKGPEGAINRESSQENHIVRSEINATNMEPGAGQATGQVAGTAGKSNAVESEDATAKKDEFLTDEELIQFKEEKFELLTTSAQEAMMLEGGDRLTAEGYFDEKIRNCIMHFKSCYYMLRTQTTLPELTKFREAVVDILLETKVLELACDVFIQMIELGWMDEEGNRNLKRYTLLIHATLILLNYSDISDKVALAISAYPGYLETVKKVLFTSKNGHLKDFLHLDVQPLAQEEEKIMKCSLTMIHNVSMRESNIHRLRKLQFTNILKPYMQSGVPSYRLTTLAGLAGIVNEEECEIIDTNQNEVKFLLSYLEESLYQQLHRCKGWSSKELALTVRLLARNDANKKLLVDLGALELLVKLGRKGYEDELYECTQAIWALCFDENNQKKIANDGELGVVELLLDLMEHGDKGVRKACEGALWTLRDALGTSCVAKYRDINSGGASSRNITVSQKKKKPSSTGPMKPSAINGRVAQYEGGEGDKADVGHVFISYQWSDQEMLKRIRDTIRGRGFKVWMDIDQMGGSTLQAMAEAVENAEVVLLSMSQKYKDSPNCRAEAEYAYQKCKKIIPLKMERGYTPDGWLGFIVGAKMYYEFSYKYPFEEKMPSLLKEIITLMDGDPSPTVPTAEPEIKPIVATTKVESHPVSVVKHTDSAIIPSASMVARAGVTKETLVVVRNWSANEIKAWMERHALKGCLPASITGGEIACLLSMRCSAPEFFFKCVNEMLKVKTLLAISKIMWALQEIEDGT